ncbi:MAG: agmatinase [Desulfobacterales bacterium]|jgi:agmatinase
MKSNPLQFLDPPPQYTDFRNAAVAILPVPYEGGVSYGTGTAGGPDAVIEASRHLELYDEVLKAEAYRMGISTVMPPENFSDAERMNAAVFELTKYVIAQNKFVVILGGDHSISSACLRALCEKYKTISVIQLDAHADLRDSYDGSPHSHACAMSRIRELTPNTLQIGIRSLSLREARRIEHEDLAVCTMAAFRSGAFDVQAALNALADPVYLTVDVDVFDWSVVRSTGTPEPGGFLWDEAVALLQQIFMAKNIVGMDVVEFCGDAQDRNSAFAVAKLIYKMLGFKLAAEVDHGRMSWPAAPRGSLFK